MRKKKKMVVYLDDWDIRLLNELNGFLKGLAAAGKGVPAIMYLKNLSKVD